MNYDHIVNKLSTGSFFSNIVPLINKSTPIEEEDISILIYSSIEMKSGYFLKISGKLC